MILEKIHYAFIYLMYKSYRIKYRKGRGYLLQSYSSSAHQNMALAFAISTTVISNILSTTKLSRVYSFFIFFVSATLLLVVLELSMSKRKMVKYRMVYPQHKKYVLYYILMLVIAILLAVSIHLIRDAR